MMWFGCFLGFTYGDCWRFPSKVFLSTGNIHVWILYCGHWLSLRSFPSASASHGAPPPSLCWAYLTPDQRHFWVVLFSPSIMSNTLQPHGLQHIRFPYPSLFPRVCLNSCPLSWWCHPTISPSLLSPALNYSQPQSLLQWVSSSHQVAKVLELQLQHQSCQWIVRVVFL